MVTASYISDNMARLDERAKDASVSIINEIGLDPGIDHCSAMKIIDEAKARGAKVKSFISWCGGLVAPEDSSNQLGYKFSWSPRGVMTAGLNPAKFKINQQVREVPSGALFANKFGNVPLYPGFAFEGLANRDSLQYADIYGLKLDDMDTMFRGTLRFQGYSEILDGLLKLGFLDLDPSTAVKQRTPFQFLASTIGLKAEGCDRSQVAEMLADKLNATASGPLVTRLLSAFEEFGMLGPNQARISAPTALDTLSQILQSSLKFKPGERDMVCLFHEFGIEEPDGSYNVQTSSLVAYGDAESGETAMARTVGVPAAIATRLLLEGKVQTHGVLRPTIPEIYQPLLERLGHMGMHFMETSKSGAHNSLQQKMAWN
ncbi:hypothetical protein IWW36_005807 [Coemansia brasiliensis]|uniref:Saccharopine dehydrogenase-like C-terminal domain-containing protein n=1 Tax=Coemansia brasiliensis TaxID=2650707 RepID=A0A9W8LXS0_9FUNG|nr:hypothetical protein IWW36_005807 [Coemansia brasiliensis]